MTEEKTYIHKRPCRNCREVIKVKIPFGMLTDIYFDKNKKCPKCGCDIVF